MANNRSEALGILATRHPRKFAFPTDEQGQRLHVSELFGANTFDLRKMKERLPRDVYNKIEVIIEAGKKLDSEVAGAIASAVKDWALEQGVTHFTHWFQPQTGMTAEKHDAFLSFNDQGQPIEKFSGSQLLQAEPDASSFPSGGMRTTFEARGYTVWDPSSPIFIMESLNGKTLCIPSAFISYHGDALDEKTPLLRSMERLNEAAVDLLHTIGEKSASRVYTTLGAEQEYFLVDRAFYQLRPDLIMSGRSLLGAKPSRHQQLEDHYFGSVPPRVLAFMQELELELFKLGIPAKTRHNEVAPSQFEIAPIFEEANVACDHNQLLMDMMTRIAERHGFACLFHEKPFAGINGSGKHNNWSMSVAFEGSNESQNLLDPGKTPHQNLRFLLMLAAILRGVHRHAGLMRAAIASPGNDHRLGANEAPPAIISVFLGSMLSDIVNKLEQGAALDQAPEAAMISLSVSKIPSVSKDNTDRNRTSPFAFTGNKFEFRAVGASMPCSFPVAVVNAAVAEAMNEINDAIKKRIKASKPIDVAVMETIREVFKECRNIRFEGNNYSEEWVAEAERRGLPNLKKAPEAIEQLLSPSSKQLLTGLGILTDAELHSRYHVMVERYVKKLLIEAETLVSMVDTYVVPAALKEQTAVANSIRALTEVNRSADVTEISSRLTLISQNVAEILSKRRRLGEMLTQIEVASDESTKAHLLAKDCADLMVAIRSNADQLEQVVSDEHWALPKYREMLFLQ
jgi:glutamine synthetase